MNLPFDRRQFIASLGGAGAVALMSHEARADALEGALLAKLDAPAPLSGTTLTGPAQAGETYPKVADLEAQIPTRHYRRGTGGLFYNPQPGGKVTRLPPMPARPTLADFFALRFAYR